jgi:hypothetical protein
MPRRVLLLHHCQQSLAPRFSPKSPALGLSRGDFYESLPNTNRGRGEDNTGQGLEAPAQSQPPHF